MATSLVAVVDDEEPVRKALGRLLRASGLDAQDFPSGQAFLDSVAARKPACLVLDLHMAGLSGLDVLARLQGINPPVPTIIITGHDEPENERRCLALGAVAYLRKPVDDRQLLETIQHAVHGGAREPDGVKVP